MFYAYVICLMNMHRSELMRSKSGTEWLQNYYLETHYTKL